MKHSWWHKLLAVMLLGVFAFNTTPREFIHQFAHHHDTTDAPLHDGIAFSAKHQHCDFLQIGIEPYEQISCFYLSPVQEMSWSYSIPSIPAVRYITYRAVSLRAPPAFPIA